MATELATLLCETLDALTENPKFAHAKRATGVDVATAIKRSEAGDENYLILWRDEGLRQFAELVPLAQRLGTVARERHLRGITINGEIQFVKDPALLARFGSDEDAKDMAELAGFPDFPFAHDVDGNRIPLLSARHPRPQRQHRPHPHTGRNGTFAKEELPPWHKSLNTPRTGPTKPATIPPPNALSDYLQTNAPKPARAMSPLVADLMARAAAGPTNPRPIDRYGRPAMPARSSVIAHGENDPPERIGA